MDFSSLLEALQNPEIYPEKPEMVELLQTHVSAIFIVGEHGYKVKKPVIFGFLAFTTLEKRKYFCREEVVLNRRLCPEVYLGVAEIRLQNGRITLGEGAGEIIEYAVLMKKLPQDCLMDRRLAESKVTPQDLARKTGADFLLIECRGEDAILPRRLSGRLGKANDPSAGRWELLKVGALSEQKKDFEKRSVVRAKCFQGPGSRQRRDWNHKALISSQLGRGRCPPPPRSETNFNLCGQGGARPMLPARSVLAPGPQPRRSPHFFKTLN